MFGGRPPDQPFIKCLLCLGVDVNVASLFGSNEINFILNVVIVFALVGLLVTLIETRLQLIGRLGKFLESYR